jgi:hypothetical protein
MSSLKNLRGKRWVTRAGFLLVVTVDTKRKNHDFPKNHNNRR